MKEPDTSPRYYLITPNGRVRLGAKTDKEAFEAFRRHWTGSPAFSWGVEDARRFLIKETREVLKIDYCVGELEG